MIETMYSTDLQKPPGANFWEWIKTAQFKSSERESASPDCHG